MQGKVYPSILAKIYTQNYTKRRSYIFSGGGYYLCVDMNYFADFSNGQD
jgi:hypothetical protein